MNIHNWWIVCIFCDTQEIERKKIHLSEKWNVNKHDKFFFSLLHVNIYVACNAHYSTHSESKRKYKKRQRKKHDTKTLRVKKFVWLVFPSGYQCVCIYFTYHRNALYLTYLFIFILFLLFYILRRLGQKWKKKWRNKSSKVIQKRFCERCRNTLVSILFWLDFFCAACCLPIIAIMLTVRRKKNGLCCCCL